MTAADVVRRRAARRPRRDPDRRRTTRCGARATSSTTLAAAPTPAYGVSTGFGALATRHVAPELRAVLQERVIRSHAAGLGDEVEREVVRAAMFLRLKTMCSGRTGVRPVVAETYAALLNAGVTPVVFEFGSLGCSGDLAPLAHCALVAMGEGEARGPSGEVARAADLLAEARIEPLRLEAKEGLALINGTDGMLGMLVLALEDLRRAATAADVAAAMSIEALLGTDQAFLREFAALRPHPGQATSAANLVALLAGSAITASHRDHDDRVQDAYSLRCAPQVARRAARHDRPRVGGRGPRARREHRQPRGPRRRHGALQRELPRRAARLRPRLPRHRRRGRRQHRRATHGPAHGPRAVRAGSRRSSPTTPASTRG